MTTPFYTLQSRLSRRTLIWVPIVAVICIAIYHTYTQRPRSVFEIDPILWADGGPSPVEIVPTFPDPPSSRMAWGRKVPNLVHYVMFARPDGTTIMDYRQYLAIRSALLIQRPVAIYMYVLGGS